MLLHEIFIIIYFVKKQMTFMVRSLVQYFAVEPGKYITWRLSESEDRGAEMKEVQYIPYSYISWAVSLQLTYVSLRCGWVHGHSKRELALLKERREIMVPEKFEVSVFDTLPYSIQTGRTLDPPVGRDPNDIRKEGERLLLNEIRKMALFAREDRTFEPSYELCKNALTLYKFSAIAVKQLLFAILFSMARVPEEVDSDSQWLGVKVRELRSMTAAVDFSSGLGL